MPSIDKLGRYEIRRELGRGAMGVVYEAYDPMIKRVVALKTIRADQLDRAEAPVVVARFRREAEAAGRLHHPNIVSIFDFDEDGGTSFIAMEYVAGRDLKVRFDAGERFPVAEAVRLTGQILDALDFSHRQGVVHRDIKPANVFLQDDGTIKVADFGIAHLDSSSLTQTGSVMGTPSCMSPEQILGLPVDGRTDVFSTGVILYQFVTGERPFGGAATTTTMQKVLKEDPLPPSTLNVQLPDAMDAIVKKALAKRPEDRYASAAEFATALRALALPRPAAASAPTAASFDGEATFVVAPSARKPAASPPPESPAATSPAGGVSTVPAKPSYARVAASSPPASPTGTRRPAIAIVVTVVALAIAAGLWWWMETDVGETRKSSSAAPGVVESAPAAPTSPVPVQPPAAAPATAAPSSDPGAVLIAAAGFADPNDPRYAGDAAKLAGGVRADARGQLVQKALGLLVDRDSLATHYEMLNTRFVARSGEFIRTVVRESEPVVGRDGLASMTTEAIVNVKAVQKSLNEMTRSERVGLIRANGDPRIAISIVAGDADRPDVPPRRSPVAENLLAERIRSFGFRTWSEDGAEAGKAADFAVTGVANVRRLSTRLEASGITVTKYALSSWTIKCVDRATGEEIYHNTALPKGAGSWASEEEALKAIGARIADEFSRDFFLQHVSVAGRRVTLTIDGLPGGHAADLVGREFIGLPAVLEARARAGTGPRAWDLVLAGSGPAADLVSSGVLAPLNAKLGRACFAPGATSGDEVRARFDPACGEADVISRLETHPPAGLYGAPAGRQKSVTTNPETLRKLSL
ncbi:eukaryotic-like serine/threonine-protein kinase [Burkholderiales bacterium]|nr:eukaryotic-like serine/threonine-protein kinase [Burkholderiales bacterium]